MKLSHILAAATVALVSSVQMIAPVSAQDAFGYSAEQDRLFLRLATGLFERVGMEDRYSLQVGSTLARADMMLGKLGCELLNHGRPVEEFRQDGEDLFAQGEEDRATTNWVVLAAAIGAYCPQHYEEYRQTFSQPSSR